VIALRITIQDRHRDVRSERGEVRLGSATEQADIVETGAAWAPQEAVLVHRGTEVELRRRGEVGTERLRVGDSVRVGDAQITLVGLLPLEGEAKDAAVVFGGYEDDWPEEQPFQLVDDLGPKDRPASPTTTTPPPEKTGPAPKDPKASEAPTKSASGPAPKTEAAPKTQAASKPSKPPKPDLSLQHLSTYRPPDFGEELLRQLKRAPFFAVSVAVHALVFLVLSFFETGPEEDALAGERGSLKASVREIEEPDNAAEEGTDELEQLASLSLPSTPPPTFPDDVAEEPTFPDDVPELDPLPDDEAAPFTVGMNPSLRSVGARTGRARGQPTKGELAEDFGQGEEESANERAADYVRGRLRRGAGGDDALLRTLTRGDLLVVSGTFDHIGKVLHALRLPYVIVPPSALAQPKTPDLSRHKVIFWNCGESLGPEQQRIATRRLRTFVKKGGYLFTTDWAISNVLAYAFPGYLGTSGPRAPLPEAIVEIRPAKGKEDHPLLEGVFNTRASGRWWLERSSFDVKVVRQRDVTVLIESPDLESRFRRSTTVAATFAHGRGRVLHVMGHYYQEGGNLAGTIAAHRLALNLVLMRLGKS
jgi:hypothetical protein